MYFYWRQGNFIRNIAVVLLLLCCALPSIVLAAQDESAVKAAFIYNFVTFVEWPNKAKKSKKVTNICVLGEDAPVTTYLNKIKEKVRNTSPIEILDKGRDSRIDECHILYISKLNSEDVDYMIGKSRNYSILTVSDVKGFAQRGGVVGFVVSEGKVRLESNVTSTKNAGLVIDSELLELMTIYH